MPYKNPKDALEYSKKYYKLNKEVIDRKYYKYWRIYSLKIKCELFKILGGAKCKYCNCKIFQCLQFDHINNDGSRHHRHPETAWRFYIKNPDLARKELQVLCANCNFIKKFKETSLSKY